jgi:hypothetical protein
VEVAVAQLHQHLVEEMGLLVAVVVQIVGLAEKVLLAKVILVAVLVLLD